MYIFLYIYIYIYVNCSMCIRRVWGTYSHCLGFLYLFCSPLPLPLFSSFFVPNHVRPAQTCFNSGCMCTKLCMSHKKCLEHRCAVSSRILLLHKRCSIWETLYAIYKTLYAAYASSHTSNSCAGVQLLNLTQLSFGQLRAPTVLVRFRSLLIRIRF